MEWKYEDVKREILQSLLNGVILELAFRGDIVIYENEEQTKKRDYKEVAAILADRISGANDEQFKGFKANLIDAIYDIY